MHYSDLDKFPWADGLDSDFSDNLDVWVYLCLIRAIFAIIA